MRAKKSNGGEMSKMVESTLASLFFYLSEATGKFLGALGNPNPFATTALRGLDHHRVADPLSSLRG